MRLRVAMLAMAVLVAGAGGTPTSALGHAGHDHSPRDESKCGGKLVQLPDIGPGCRRGELFRVELPDGDAGFVHGGDAEPTPTTLLGAVAAYETAAAAGGNGKGGGKGGGSTTGGGGSTSGTTTSLPAPTASPEPTWVCASEPEFGYQLIWTPATATPSNPSTTVATIRSLVNSAMLQVQQRGLELAPGQRYRLKVRCDETGQPDVAVEPLVDVGTSPSFFTIVGTLAERGYSRSDTNYLVMTSFSAWYAGIAFMGSPSGAGGLYSQISNTGWTPRTVMHEMMHNMGAVPAGSPNNSGAAHCNDGLDVMCYADGGSTARYTTSACRVQVVDCGADDYFNPAPAPGSFLATHDNLALGNRSFLVQRDGDVTPPEVTLDPDVWTRPGRWYIELDRSRTWRPPTGIRIFDAGGIRSATWRIDGGEAFTRYDGELPGQLSTGTHQVEVTVRDTVGLTASASGTVKVDREAPYIDMVQPAAFPQPIGRYWHVVGMPDPTEVSAYLSAWFEHSKLVGWQYCFVVWETTTSTDACTDSTSAKQPLVDWTGTGVTALGPLASEARAPLATALAEGSYVTVCARAEDAAGNQTLTRCSNQRALVDLTSPAAPTSAMESANGVTDLDWWRASTGDVPIAYESGTNTGGTSVRTLVCVTRTTTCDDGPLIGWREWWGGRIPLAEPLAESDFVRVCAKNQDLAGNDSALTCGDGMRVDATMPTVTVEPLTTPVAGRQLAVRVTVADAHSGMRQLWFSSGGSTLLSAMTGGSYVVQIPGWHLVEGTKLFEVRADDHAFNMFVTTISIVVGPVPTAPVPGIDGGSSGAGGASGGGGTTPTSTSPGPDGSTQSSTPTTTGTGTTAHLPQTASPDDTTSVTTPTSTGPTSDTSTGAPAGSTAAPGARCGIRIDAQRVVRLRSCSRSARVQQLVGRHWVAARARRVANHPGRDRWRVVVGRRTIKAGIAG